MPARFSRLAELLVAATIRLVWLCALAGCDGSAGNPAIPVSTKSDWAEPEFSGPPAAATFVDVTGSSGIAFRYEHDPDKDLRSILEALGGGVGMFDYDGDGLLDLCYAGGGRFGEGNAPRGLPLACYRNRGGFHFEDVTSAGNMKAARFYSHGVHEADFDRDGFADFVITGYGGLQLWHNQGDGSFMEILAGSGMDQDKLWSTSAAWGDFNRDGELDLYVAHYVNWSPANNPSCPARGNPAERDNCSPKAFQALPDEMFLSNGDGTYRASAEACGLSKFGKGLGVITFDADNDGDTDVYVANDSTANFLYLNDGTGKLTEVAATNGCAYNASGTPDGSMGVDILDFNHDGLPEIFVANFDGEYFALYRNDGMGQFSHDSLATGLVAVGDRQVAFGVQTVDIDHDGDEDVFAANGHPSLFPFHTVPIPKRQKPQLLIWENESFRVANTSLSAYMKATHEGRGLALGDLDGDGDLDVSISHLNEPVALLRTDLEVQNHYLLVRLIGTRSPREPVGARLVLHTSLGDRTRQFRGGGSYLSTPAPEIHWGLPEGASAKQLTIYWPSGQVQEVHIESLDRRLTIIESAEETSTAN